MTLGAIVVLHGRQLVAQPPSHHLLARFADRIEAFYDRAYVPLVVVGLCLLGSICYGLSSILEQREAAAAPPGTAMRIGLLTHLIQRPRWLLGNLAGLVGFVLQLLALRHGSLALVQPLFVSGLVFALVGGAILEHRRLARREWLSMALVTAGLVAFLVIAKPGRGHPNATTAGWIALTVATVLSVGGVCLLGLRSRQLKPLFLATGAGILFGVTAAVAERTSHLLEHGLLPTLGHVPPYAMFVCAIAALVLSQSAFQAAELRWSLPTLTIVEPLVAILIGQVLYGEHISLGGLAVAGEAIGLAMMIAGVFGLSQGIQHPPRVPNPA
ncbi:MAG TPA: DMT family transporter [Solirubrobacteraceae bacterium]|jgi:drug/metabolite transporter (DMT)-like permease|nr:DMT family transporter [Solirubrobacteraceae bacterium]